jgi:hypothetical protein
MSVSWAWFWSESGLVAGNSTPFPSDRHAELRRPRHIMSYVSHSTFLCLGYAEHVDLLLLIEYQKHGELGKGAGPPPMEGISCETQFSIMP